jgi:hypothetical protein
MTVTREFGRLDATQAPGSTHSVRHKLAGQHESQHAAAGEEQRDADDRQCLEVLGKADEREHDPGQEVDEDHQGEHLGQGRTGEAVSDTAESCHRSSAGRPAFPWRGSMR